MNISIILVFLSTQVFSAEITDRYYSRTNYICSNKTLGCTFTVSSSYPISPIIPTGIPTKAILNEYRYIYLLFSIPRNQTQKTFYLEAYDISNQETIISNGDCYFIDTNENTDYEIRIFKKLKESSFLRFGFLGIPKNFIMTVRLEFELSLSLYWNDIALGKSNSIYKTNEPSLVEYLKEYEKKLIKQRERQLLAKQAILRIIQSMFLTSIDINIFKDDFIFSIIFYFYPLTVTVTFAVGLELTGETILEPGKIVISETQVIKGTVAYHQDGHEFLDGKINLNSNLLKILDSYRNEMLGHVLEFGIETDYYTVTVSIDDNLALIYTTRFYGEDTKTIYYEIEFKLELDNDNLKGIVFEEAMAYAYAYEYPYQQYTDPKIYRDPEFDPFLFGILLGSGGYLLYYFGVPQIILGGAEGIGNIIAKGIANQGMKLIPIYSKP